jgi:hypothetical protein
MLALVKDNIKVTSDLVTPCIKEMCISVQLLASVLRAMRQQPKPCSKQQGRKMVAPEIAQCSSVQSTNILID